MIAKEMKLNRMEAATPDDPEEARWQRATQRLWRVSFLSEVFA
jgi:hypothetical protein